MCLSIPMRVVEWDDEEGFFAWVERGEGDNLRRERVNMMLIGAQPVGTWILASLGLAKETVEEEDRLLIEDALAALDASLHGDYDPSQHFVDLK
ncbi:MAG: HypC/HybG/HupF family hydrogenase formation chaperone [Zoogloeaceae bacterium]|nr:HypC/HybG/HupF family hydrogenase formation chaperone [Zoogloeaceae bacterium]